MHLFDHEDSLLRPVGLHTPPGRRFLRPRQLVSIALVLIIGGGLGTGAYFLSDLDLRDVIGLLDIGDKGPKLSLQMPDKGDNAGPLLAPPGGEAAAPLPAATTPASPAVPATAAPPAKAPAPAAAPPGPAPAAPPMQPVSVTVPPPVSRPAGKPPSYATLPALPAAKPLPPAPVKDLLAESAGGPLPVVAADGRQPWRVYARPFDAPAGKPRLAVVITDLGLDRTATEAALTRLPPDVSLAFSPYAPDLAKWIRQAREAGHEALVMLPASADPAERDPGPLGLRADATAEDNTARLESLLAKAPGTVGVAAMPGRFDDSPQLAPVLAGLLQRGLLYVGSGVRGPRVPPAAAITLVADQESWRDAVDARLAAGLEAAKGRGGAVLLASARPVTLDRLAAFLAGLDGQGVALAPVSALAKPPGSP